MIDRARYYSIVRNVTIDAGCRSVGCTWYLSASGVTTDCVPFLMGMIAFDMLYDLGF